MTPQSLQAVLRTLTDTGDPVSDAELLRRFLADDEAAFTELVKRHGRLVWAVCRNLTRSDCEADDAFQATFLVLLKNAGKVRDAGKLSAWLHGVAYKVCGKARQGAKRRTAREQATAHHEGNGTVVPESAWDRALAAVHEEVANLPETLRVPFVLCCLEGKGVTEAAAQLGWKLGTLSGRLTRAKDAVLAKLDARGLTLGVVAAVGLAVPPAAVVAKTTALAQAGFVVPGSLLQLTHGVLGMSATSVKVLAAAVLLACGLGLSVGGGWVATAEAQQPEKVREKVKGDVNEEVKRLQRELDRTRDLLEAQAQKQKLAADAERQAREAAEKAVRAAEIAKKRAADDAAQAMKQAAERIAVVERLKSLNGAAGKASTPSFKTARWEYAVVDHKAGGEKADFAKFLQDQENAGWEFLGAFAAPDKLLFRRPVKGASSYYGVPNAYNVEKYITQVAPGKPYVESVQVGGEKRYIAQVAPGKPIVYTGPSGSKPVVIAGPGGTKSVTVVETVRRTDDPKAIEAEIAKLTEKLAELKKRKSVPVAEATLTSPLDPNTLRAALTQLAEKKFGKEVKFDAVVVGQNVRVSGEAAVVEWAITVVKSLAGK